VLSIGLNVSLGTVKKPKPVEAVPEQCLDPVACPDCPAPVECPKVATLVDPTCADRDGDGVCDRDDRCPTDIGPASSFGCPLDPCRGVPLSVLVQFPQNSAVLPPPRDDDPQTMDPVLESIAKAMGQDATCRVCVIGYASEEGTDRRNEELSDQRAAAVKKYLGARGLESKRILVTGMGARCQVVPEASRTMNRRVEFRRLQDGEACPTECSP
jgi:OmpA-OmpF porin, OOP family